MSPLTHNGSAEWLFLCAGDYGGSENDEEAVSDTGAVEGAGHTGDAAGGESADDSGGDSSSDAHLEDDGLPCAEDVCAPRISFAVAGWDVPAGDAAEEDAVRFCGSERGYAVLG